MFNPFGMNKDLKGMEKMVKPALEKFMLESGFVKKEELNKALDRIAELEEKVANLGGQLAVKASSIYLTDCSISSLVQSMQRPFAGIALYPL